MYFTRFHKNIFKELWKNHKADKFAAFDLEAYMEFCLKWHFPKSKYPLYIRSDKNEEYFVYSGYEFNNKIKRYLIKDKKEMLLYFEEFTSLMKYLTDNNLISIAEKEPPSCIPVFIERKEDTATNQLTVEPFTEGLEIVKRYIGKNVQVREGYKDFRRFNLYLSDAQLLNLIIGICVPIITAILAFLLAKLF
jgi:hypothetical protein